MNFCSMLTTEIKAENLSSLERFADVLLTPVQYLWNGRKVDFIQGCSNQKACQMDFIYTPEKRSWIRTCLMIVALFLPPDFDS